MELRITRNATLQELKKQFSRQLPNLKLEFYRRPHRRCPHSIPARQLDDQASLGMLSGLRKEGVFTYTKSTTVREFEEGLQQQFGLAAQVFRNDDGHWVNTTQTDHWSLGKQNALTAATNHCYRSNVNCLFL